MKPVLLAAALLFSSTESRAAKEAFPPTHPGAFEVKTLPAGRLLQSTSDQPYFSRANGMFGPLFRYISRHDISMTTPVEAQIDPGAMYFWVAEDQIEKATGDTDDVTVIDVPERHVAAAGFRGGYNQTNFEEGKAQLLAWVGEQNGLELAGEPFAVFWNGPMTPSFLKRFEVQVVVTKTD